jgi:equilibrative nucleoside transporter 1/2/3
VLNGVVQARFGAYLQTSVIAVASLFGPSAVQSVMSGQAASAVVISAVQVVSAAAFVWGKSRQQAVSDGSAEERSAFMFFSLSTLFLAATTVLHRWLVRLPAYQQVAAALEKQTKNHPSGVDHGEIQGLMTRHAINPKNDISHAFRIAKQNAIYEVAVAYVFGITLVRLCSIHLFHHVLIKTEQAVFPAITTSIQPTNPSTHPLLFTAVHFLVFNVADFLGRYVCSFPRFIIWSGRRLFALSVARTLFIPLFLMCNVQHGSGSSPAPVISSDFIFMLLLSLFGWSNGYVSSLCLMAAPSLDHNPRLNGRLEDVDVAATVISFCLVGGLVAGSLSSFAVKGAICGCNPFTS